MLKKVKASEAVGMVLGYDITEVVPGKWKGPALRKGHRIREEDVEVLLRTGNDYVWVIEPEEGELHEDEGAMRLARAAAGEGLEVIPGREGRALIRTTARGLLKVQRELVDRINLRGELVLSTLHDNTPCEEGTLVAIARIIPLMIKEAEIRWAEGVLSHGRTLHLKPYRRRRVGAVVTGNEVYYGRIPDAFDEKVRPKLQHYGAELLDKVVVPDDPQLIAEAITSLLDRGADLIITTGGLSVDPGDVTPEGIRLTGAEIINYGSPVLPGAMFLYAILGEADILGLPACVYYNPRTIFDLVLPRVMAGERPSREEIRRLGYGGLCLNCAECRFPVCPFGRV